MRSILDTPSATITNPIAPLNAWTNPANMRDGDSGTYADATATAGDFKCEIQSGSAAGYGFGMWFYGLQVDWELTASTPAGASYGFCSFTQMTGAGTGVGLSPSLSGSLSVPTRRTDIMPFLHPTAYGSSSYFRVNGATTMKVRPTLSRNGSTLITVRIYEVKFILVDRHDRMIIEG